MSRAGGIPVIHGAEDVNLPMSRARSRPKSRSRAANVSNFAPSGRAPSAARAFSSRSAAGVSRSSSKAEVTALRVPLGHRQAGGQGPFRDGLPPAPQRLVRGVQRVPAEVDVVAVPLAEKDEPQRQRVQAPPGHVRQVLRPVPGGDRPGRREHVPHQLAVRQLGAGQPVRRSGADVEGRRPARPAVCPSGLDELDRSLDRLAGRGDAGRRVDVQGTAGRRMIRNGPGASRRAAPSGLVISQMVGIRLRRCAQRRIRSGCSQARHWRGCGSPGDAPRRAPLRAPAVPEGERAG